MEEVVIRCCFVVAKDVGWNDDTTETIGSSDDSCCCCMVVIIIIIAATHTIIKDTMELDLRDIVSILVRVLEFV